MEEVSIIGIDLAKRSFQVHGAKADGSVAYRRKLSRGKLLSFLASQPPCTVAMEACASAHYWGREIVALGHEGSGAASDHALRGGQDGGAAGAGDAVSHA